jgi:cell division protein FtsB
MNACSALWTRLQSLGLVVFGLAALAGVFMLFLPLLHQRRALQHQLKRLDQEIARQESIEKRQRAEIEALRTDPLFVERTARDKLHLARPNETVFRFEPPRP